MKNSVIFLSLVALFFAFVNTNFNESSRSFETNVKAILSDRKNQSPSSIHIQFIDKPIFNNALKTKTGRSNIRPFYAVIYDYLEQEVFLFDDLKVKKTLTYTPQSDMVVLRRYIDFFEFQEFLVHKGDSILMSFDISKPVKIKYSTFEYAPNDFNVENILNKKSSSAYTYVGKSDDVKMTSFKYFFDNPEESAAQLRRTTFEKVKALERLETRVSKDLLPSMNTLQKDVQEALDSLLYSKQISRHTYDFYKRKYANLLLKLEIMAESKDSITAANEINKIFDNKTYIDEYFNQCLESFRKVNYQSKIIPYERGMIRDPRGSFILVKNSLLLNPKVKDRLLFLNLGLIDVYFHDEVEEYLKLLVKTASDISIAEKAKFKFKKDILPSTTPSNLHLLTLSQNQTTIEELIKTKKGKVIYIDFWASWCGPCIQEMKYSRSLIQEYTGKNLEVVFLSLDENVQKWEKAAERQNITLGNCLKILNSKGSSFIKEYKITTIPRYMIIDKNGKVINGNAPRPSDPKIRQLFDELLKK
jgi:thiol-disulfide isomerase/thioredoxin